jgi:putative ABC transport system substrate-binding protein
LPRPGTNATGITVLNAETGAKRIELLNEIFPKLRRVGVLHNPGDSASIAQLPIVVGSIRALGKELMVVEARAAVEFAAAFAKLAEWRAEALVMLENALYVAHRKTLLDWAAKHRWPTINSSKEYAEAGGVISYGADWADSCRRSAVYVDKILKGAKPTDLPVEQPTKFEFVINLKAANAMGLSIPKAVLLRADRVIE